MLKRRGNRMKDVVLVVLTCSPVHFSKRFAKLLLSNTSAYDRVILVRHELDRVHSSHVDLNAVLKSGKGRDVAMFARTYEEGYVVSVGIANLDTMLQHCRTRGMSSAAYGVLDIFHRLNLDRHCERGRSMFLPSDCRISPFRTAVACSQDDRSWR